MWLKLITAILGILAKLSLKKKREADAAKADALEKTVESVNKSLAVEEGIRKKQDAVDANPTEVKGKDGGLNFDRFNKGSR